MAIWKEVPTLDVLAARAQGTLIAHLGIEFLDIGEDFLRARMPVDERTFQPAGILHGGASVVLAETLGSVGGRYCVEEPGKTVVGLEINANHVRSVRAGWVHGTARPQHLGRSTQLWEIRVEDENAKLVCVSRLTLAVIDRPSALGEPCHRLISYNKT